MVFSVTTFPSLSIRVAETDELCWQKSAIFMLSLPHRQSCYTECRREVGGYIQERLSKNSGQSREGRCSGGGKNVLQEKKKKTKKQI